MDTQLLFAIDGTMLPPGGMVLNPLEAPAGCSDGVVGGFLFINTGEEVDEDCVGGATTSRLMMTVVSSSTAGAFTNWGSCLTMSLYSTVSLFTGIEPIEGADGATTNDDGGGSDTGGSLTSSTSRFTTVSPARSTGVRCGEDRCCPPIGADAAAGSCLTGDD